MAQYGGQWHPSYAAPMVSPPNSGMAVASLVCGLLGFVIGLPGLLGVIFGIIGINQTRGGRTGGRGMAVAGLVCGAVSMIFWGGCLFGPIMTGFSRGMRQAQQTAKVVQCSTNLQQIGAGLLMYSANNSGKFPPKLGALLEGGFVTPSVLLCPHTADTPAPGGD